MKKYTLRLAAALLLLVPSLALAHEQWFINPEVPAGELPAFFTQWSGARFAILGAIVVAFVVAVLLNQVFKKWPLAKKAHAWAEKYHVFAPQVLAGAFGVLLIISSLTGGVWAPDLKFALMPKWAAVPLWIAQYLAGFALVMGLWTRTAAALGLLAYIVTFFFFPVVNLLSYLGFAGGFVYMLAVGNPYAPKVCNVKWCAKITSWLAAHQRQAFMVMRVALGLSFIGMGIAFKLMQPQYTLQILAQHPVNFFPLLGFTNFTNEMFVFAAGLTEVMFGLLLTFNILPRLVSLKLFVLFFLTIFEFGLVELFGHLPLFAMFFAIATQQKKEA